MLGVKDLSKRGNYFFRAFQLVLMILPFMVSVTVVSATDLVDLGMTCGSHTDTIWVGEPATFDVYIENDNILNAVQLGFHIWSSDGATWQWQDVGGYGSSTACVTVVPGCRMDPPSSVWNQTDLIVSERDVDEVSPDSLLVAGIAATGGLPSGSLEHMMSFNFTAGPDADGVYHICIDSTMIPPNNDFVFIDVTGTYAPHVAWPEGGLCWPVKRIPNLEPVFTNCPTEMLYAPMCDVFAYDLDTHDPEGEPIDYFVISYNGAGYATIDQDGLLTCGFALGDLYTPLTVEVEACDQHSLCDTCNINIMVINEIPVIDCGALEDSVVAGQTLVKSDIIATDPDGCPNPLEYFIVSGPGTIHPETGEYTWTTTPADIGLWEVEVAASDGSEISSCMFSINVLAGDDCDNPISIDDLPFEHVASTEDYSDLIHPDLSLCGITDPDVGIGPEIVFHYYPIDVDSIYLNVLPLNDWDVVVYVLDASDPSICLAAADDAGPFGLEVITLDVDPGMGYCIVVDGKGASSGPVCFNVNKGTDKLCKEIELLDQLFESIDPDPDKFGDKSKSYAGSRQLSKPITGNKSNCDKTYKITAKKLGIVYAKSNGEACKDLSLKGTAKATLTLSGTYTVKPKKSDDTTTTVKCKCFEYMRAKMEARKGANGSSKAQLVYDRTIEPFVNEPYHLPNTNSKGELEASKTNIREKTSVPDTIKNEADVPFDTPQSISLNLSVSTETGKGSDAKAEITSLHLKIVCLDPPTEDGNCENYPVEFNISDAEIIPLITNQDAAVTLPPDFGETFTEIDSGDYSNNGIVFSNLPAFDSRLFFTNRINELEYDLDEEVIFETPSDTSWLFTMSGGVIDTFEISDILSAPSDILFDTLGHFGNKLFVAQSDSFDSMGTPVIGYSSIVSIDEFGSLDTLENGLNSPTGMAFTEGAPFGNNLYVVESEIGQVISIDPAGNATPFAVGLKDPLDLVAGTGAFGDYLYVIEYDTSVTEPFPQPDGGRIVRVDAAGVVTAFVDPLQGPVDMEFGPGGVFGTDLYVALDNEFSLDTFYVPNTGKIVAINSAGVVTDFATGLEYPQYITFDPSGVLYVGVAGGIIKIGPSACGDSNGDGNVNIGDAVYLLNYIFRPAECDINPPIGCPPEYEDAGDVNNDGSINIGDAVYMNNFIFNPDQCSINPPIGCPPDCGP